MSDSRQVEKRVAASAVLLMAAMFGLIVFAALRLNLTVPTCLAGVPTFDSGYFKEIGPGRYEAHIVARMWAFEPDTFKVPKGAIVDFFLVSADVAHGFHVAGTNVNLMALPAVVNYSQARFDKAGTFPILCHEYCGLGHAQMAASLEVTP